MSEAIVLAGGFGTRLRSVVEDLPKPMAPIRDVPFLAYLMHYLSQQGVTRVVLSTGYKHEKIADYFGTGFLGIKIDYFIEDEPLGTGGAIKAALGVCEQNQVLVLNGDTLFPVDIHTFRSMHETKRADISIALKPMINFDRYGTVMTGREHRVVAFKEKMFRESGNINGGVYMVKRDLFQNLQLPPVFSFEKDILEKHLIDLSIYGFTYDDYFIDIGIPDDYYRAQQELGLFPC